jgi:hypothetical protein
LEAIFVYMKDFSNYLNIIQNAWTKNSQEKLIEFLYDLNFRFISREVLLSRGDIIPTEILEYSYMVRMAHIGKSPKKDKPDFTITFAIDLDNQANKIYILKEGKPFMQGNKIWDKPKSLNFKPRKKGTKYPDAMSIQDRIDFRRIEKKLVNRGVDEGERDFYNKWAEAVIEINKGIKNI